MKWQIDETEVGEMTYWWNAKCMWWEVSEMAIWWNGKLLKWPIGTIGSLWNVILMKWQVHEIVIKELMSRIKQNFY